jgi:hypothetical protein
MKTPLLALVFLAAGWAGAVARDDAVPLPAQASASVGMTREALLAQLGPPDLRLGTDSWVFFGFRAQRRPADERSDALVVVFAGGCVTRVRLTERAAVEAPVRQWRTRHAWTQ